MTLTPSATAPPQLGTSRNVSLSPTPARREWIAVWVILAVGVAIRCVGLTQAFVDVWAWRQSDVAMIADNFYRNGFNLFYPQVNWGGGGPGYVGTEFPLLHYLAALVYPLLGPQEWIGRALVVACFAASVPALFLLARRMTRDPVAALAAVAIYTVIPLSIFSSRSFMPDMPTLALALWGVHLTVRWAEEPANRRLGAGAIITFALALLVKITSAAILGVAFVLILAGPTRKALLRPALWVALLIALLPAFFWYRHAFAVGRSYFPFHAFGGDGMKIESAQTYLKYLVKAYHNGFTPMLCFLALPGFMLACRRLAWGPLAWLAAMAAFFVVAGRGNRHLWYQLPAAPVLAIFAGMTLAAVWHFLSGRTWTRAVAGTLIAAAMAWLSFTSYRAVSYLYDPWYADILVAADAVKRLTPPDALVVAAVDTGEPLIFYYQQRRGWLFPTWGQEGTYSGPPSDADTAIKQLELRKSEGATHFLVTWRTLPWLTNYPEFTRHLDTRYRRAASTPDYVLFDLRPATAVKAQ